VIAMNREDAELARLWNEFHGNRPADQSGQQAWRETLMTLGHDPIRADASAGSDI
jgi:hypothetical protein